MPAPSLAGALKVHLRAADAAAAGTGGAVASLADSASGAIWSQATATKQPTYQPAAAGGRPALVFDGTDDALSGDATVRAVLNGKPGCTLFVVLYTSTVGSANRNALQFSTNSSASARALVGRSTNSKMRGGGRRLDANSLVAIGAVAAQSSGTVELWTSVMDTPAAVLTLYRNGELDNSGTFQTAGSFSATSSAAVSVGAAAAGTSEYWLGGIAEVLVYDRVLTSDERAQVHSYVQEQGYGITVADYTPAVISSPWSNVETITTASAATPVGAFGGTNTVITSVVGSRPSIGTVSESTATTTSVVGSRPSTGAVVDSTTVTTSVVGSAPTVGTFGGANPVTTSVVGASVPAGAFGGAANPATSVTGSRPSTGVVVSSTPVETSVVGLAPAAGVFDDVTVVLTEVAGRVEARGSFDDVTVVLTEVAGRAPALTGKDITVVARVEPGAWSATVEPRHFAAVVMAGGWGSSVEAT